MKRLGNEKFGVTASTVSFTSYKDGTKTESKFILGQQLMNDE